MGNEQPHAEQWHTSIASHEDLTPRVKDVLYQGIHELKDMRGRTLVNAYTRYAEEPEPGDHCSDLVHVFSDGSWAFLELRQSHRGAWGREATTYVRCAPETFISPEHTYIDGVAMSHYHRLELLHEAGLLTADELATQWALEQQCWAKAKAAHDQRWALDEAARAARKAEREEQAFQRMLKKKGLRTVPE
jgi:hypothetical protein